MWHLNISLENIALSLLDSNDTKPKPVEQTRNLVWIPCPTSGARGIMMWAPMGLGSPAPTTSPFEVHVASLLRRLHSLPVAFLGICNFLGSPLYLWHHPHNFTHQPLKGNLWRLQPYHILPDLSSLSVSGGLNMENHFPRQPCASRGPQHSLLKPWTCNGWGLANSWNVSKTTFLLSWFKPLGFFLIALISLAVSFLGSNFTCISLLANCKVFQTFLSTFFFHNSHYKLGKIS